MPDWGGFGTGIGEGMSAAAANLRRNQEVQLYLDERRDKQVELLNTRGMDLAGKLLDSGFTTRHDPQAGGPVLIDRKTKEIVQHPPLEVGQIFDEFVNTSKQARSLFAPHETGSLIQSFKKLLGKQSKPAQEDPRAGQYTTQAMQARVPNPPPFKWSGDAGEFIQLSRLALDPSQPQEARAAAAAKLKSINAPETNAWKETDLKPFSVEGDPRRKPGVYHQVARTKEGQLQTATELMPGVPTSAIAKEVKDPNLSFEEQTYEDFLKSPEAQKYGATRLGFDKYKQDQRIEAQKAGRSDPAGSVQLVDDPANPGRQKLVIVDTHGNTPPRDVPGGNKTPVAVLNREAAADIVANQGNAMIAFALDPANTHIFGKEGGLRKWAAGKIGTNDPALAGLGAQIESLSSFMTVMHGARGAALAKGFKESLNNADSPQAFAEALRQYVQSAQRMNGQIPQGGAAGGRPPLSSFEGK